MVTVPQLDPHTAGIIAALEAAGIVTGDGADPLDEHGSPRAGWQGTPGQSPFLPYCVLYPPAAKVLDGSIGDPNADLSGTWQVTSIGPTPAAARYVSDQVRSVLVDAIHTVTIEGRRVMSATEDVGGQPRRDDGVQPPLWYSPDRFRISTTPA